jgi:hypothetical protein
MPQYAPWPKVPEGKAAKFPPVEVFDTLSVMPVAHKPPPLLPDSVPQ